jgi:hypothetical protein
MLVNTVVQRICLGLNDCFREVKITIKVHRDEFLERQYLALYRLIRNNKWRWQAVSAVLACGGGLLLPLVALTLNFLATFTRLSYEKPLFAKASTVMYILTVPSLLLGAHFLDLLDRCDASANEEKVIEPAIGQLGLPTKAEDF